MIEDEKSQGTPVDLGDDLLEGLTKPISTSATSTQVKNPFKDFEDALQSAKILMSEGILEEAKKTLRKLMLIDPGHATVRKLLNEIHESELKQIFGEQPKRKTFLENTTEKINSDQALKELDEYLQLGVFSSQGSEKYISQLSLFKDSHSFEKFTRNLESELKLKKVTLQDRLDLAVAFIEFGLFDVAVQLLRELTYQDLLEDELISVVSLLAHTYIEMSKPYEAALCLEALVRETEINSDKKIELYYLMGRSQEMLNQKTVAQQWYLQVKKTDPHYRDLEERLNHRP